MKWKGLDQYTTSSGSPDPYLAILNEKQLRTAKMLLRWLSNWLRGIADNWETKDYRWNDLLRKLADLLQWVAGDRTERWPWQVF